MILSNFMNVILRTKSVRNQCKASGYTVYLLVNLILKIMVHLQMLYSQLEDQQVAPPTHIIFILAPKVPLSCWRPFSSEYNKRINWL